MPNSRAVLFFRRLSSNDSKIKNFNFNSSAKEVFTINPACNQRDFCWSVRASSFCNNHQLHSLQLKRSWSDKNNIINMAAANTENNHDETPRFTNNLVHEKSLYLQQHAHNPVNWNPWCQEVLDKAKKEDKLIFLSVGYSTCHWCHVMEEESFQNENIAKVLNDHYISIKLDREERPDLDKIYMMYITATSRQGGWPMNLILMPDLIPIQGGTYYPPEDFWGFKGLKTVLLETERNWREKRQKVIEVGETVMDHIRLATELNKNSSSSVPGESTWFTCAMKFIELYEPEFGGFGTAQKFPQVPALNFLFHYYARDKNDPRAIQCLDMCLNTLTKMAKGGIHDHISNGFARYSTDSHWHLPHFEKMLNDQAQLAYTYSNAYLATNDEYFADVVHDILKYVNRDLRHAYGGYYSAEDADSYPNGELTLKYEGAFYVWEYKELQPLLEGKSINSNSYLDIFCDYYSIEENGNIVEDTSFRGEFDNKNVLIIYGSDYETMEKFGLTQEQFKNVINECKEILFKAQQTRARPQLDTKILCSWNGLMISGLAHAGQSLEEKKYVEDAIKTANFIKDYLFDEDNGTLTHCCYRTEDNSIVQGKNPINGMLEDYAFLIRGLLDLYEATFDRQWLNWAKALQHKQDDLFWDPNVGGYYMSCSSDKSVLIRIKEDQDCAEPAGNSVACQNLLRLSAHADKGADPKAGQKERQMARKMLVAYSHKMDDIPNLLPEMISALMLYCDSPTLVSILGRTRDPRTMELVRAVRSRLLPGRVLAVIEPSETAALTRTCAEGDAPTVYVCRQFACSLPVSDIKLLENLLDEPPYMLDVDKKTD